MSEPQHGAGSEQPGQPSLNKPEGGPTGPPQQPPPGYGGQQQPQQPPYGAAPQQPGGMPPQGYGGPAAELAPTEQRQWAMFAHLSGLLNIFGGWAVIPALVIFIVFKDRGAYVRTQSVEALNFQITLVIAFIVSWILTVVIIGFLMLLALVILSVVFAILGGMAANRGEDYRYPFNVRLVK